MARERFQQHIESLPRGRIRYRVDVWSTGADVPMGYRVEEGRRLSAHFAGTPWRRVWIVTHLPSGKSVGHTLTVAEALWLAAKIEPLALWGRQLSTAYYRRLLPTIRLATGGWPEALRRVT